MTGSECEQASVWTLITQVLEVDLSEEFLLLFSQQKLVFFFSYILVTAVSRAYVGASSEQLAAFYHC